MDLSSKTIYMIDEGLFASWAVKLSEYFGRVLYYSEFKSAFPKIEQFAIGKGLENVERVVNQFDPITNGEVDIFFFPDVYRGDLQVHLRSLGYPVWGCGKGEELELYRWQTKQFLRKDLKLPVQPVERIIGMDALREYLMEHDNVYVKISMLRGDMETFRSDNYKLSEPILDELEHRLGPFIDDKEFIVENAIDDAVEVGYDGFTIDGQYPSPSIQGYEIKDVAYIGVCHAYQKLPKQVKEVNSRLAPVFEAYNYRGFWSSEIRVQKDGKPYLTDPCCRAGSPPSELYQEMFQNWGDIIWGGAQGELVTPKPVGKFGVEVLIHSDWADKNWQAVYIPNEIRKWVKLRNVCEKNGVLYCAPQTVGLPEIGAVIAVDDSLLGAIKKIKGYCQEIQGHRINLNLKHLMTAVDTIREGESAGIPFSDSPLPTAAQIAAVLQ